MGFFADGNWRLPLTVISFFVLWGLSCAKQGLPPGGREDKEPPELVSSIPADMTVGVKPSEQIIFEFSKPMNEKSVEDNFLMVPVPSSWPEFSWRSWGRVLVVDPVEPLRTGTTYVISIGAKASDLRRNKLDDTVTITFSTGETIENGIITGTVIPFGYFDEKPENVSGVDVVAYRLDEQRPSPDPGNDVPDYFTQSGADGSYEIRGLSQAVYRIFAIGDSDGDGFYSEGADMIGIAPHDVRVARDESVTAPPVMISAKDTTCVQLRSVRAPDSGRVELFFDRPVVPEGIGVDIDGLDVSGWFVDAVNRQKISVATGLQEKGRRYNVTSLTVFDADGNTIAPFSSPPVFAGTDKPDTTSLEIVDRGPEILFGGDKPVRLIFNRMLALSEQSDAKFALEDESGEDLTISCPDPNLLEISAPGGWKEGYRYSLSLDSDLIRGISGNLLADSGREVTFRTAPADTLGFISGSIDDPAGSAGSVYHMFLKHLDTGSVVKAGVRDTTEWSSGGVLPGRYISLAYRDDDGDGALFRGIVNPFRAAEPVAVYPDTIKVISRWTEEDVRIIFR